MTNEKIARYKQLMKQKEALYSNENIDEDMLDFFEEEIDNIIINEFTLDELDLLEKDNK